MQQAVHQTLINDIETLLTKSKSIDETQAKNYRQTAETLISAHADHPLGADLTNCLDQLRKRVHAQIAKRDADYELLMAELKKARAGLEEEKLKVAEDATHKALSIAGQIPGLSAQRRRDMEKQLDVIYPHMRKLSAWRHWGTTQARENLIAQIKQIHGSDMDPDNIVKTLREAKAQWQDWEKSGDHSEHALWKEFSKACDTAYEPCRAFYKAQKEERKKNLAQKRELLEEIDARFEKIDWSQPDWKEIDQWLRQVRSRFFKIGHTDYKQHKKLRTRLDTALAQFEVHLSRERERSLKMRRKLIDDIQALEVVEDVREAISQLDQLRKKWQITVLDKRGVENKLWDQYQKAQDVIYSRRNTERKEQDQARNENLKLKRRVVEDLIKASGASVDDLIKGQSVLAQHKDRFNEVGYVPRKAEKSLMDSWQSAQKQFGEASKNAQKARARNAQNTLLEKARFCTAIEQSKQQTETLDAAETPDTPDTIKAYQALPPLSSDLEALFQKRLDAALNETAYPDAVLRKNTDAQLLACLKAEVMLDLPSPEQYSKQRMAYQIERLSASMKKNAQAQENIETLKQQLLTTGPIQADQHDAIVARIAPILGN
jgi:exonuclease SbcC